jgi:hypothetical protein
MTDDTSISKSKADVENWRRGYEAALSGLAYVWAGYEKTSAWRIGYRDGRAMRLKQHAEAKHLDGWPVGRTLSVPETSAASPALLAVTHRPVPVASVKP